jgi:serpin B
MNGLRTILLVMAGIACVGCATGGQEEEVEVRPVAREMVVNGNNQFALELYSKLRGGEDNLFFSPYSVSTALAMVYAGARDATAEQMARALRYPTEPEVLSDLGMAEEPMTPEEFAAAFGQIMRDLNEQGSEEAYELRIANALWAQEDFDFLDSFVEFVESQYEGRVRNVDFVAATEQVRQRINAWVEEQTNGKIQDLLSPGTVDVMTRLVLTNAIYFKGDWARQFQEERTQEAAFTLVGGETVQVPMMNQRAEFGYAQADELQVLRLPYVGEELSMIILLPSEADGIGQLEQQLSRGNLEDWVNRLGEREVIVSVPKFEMTSKFSMQGVLRSMGMARAFSDDADFSGMTGRRNLFLSAVIHQAYIDVNEEGTEAAAATGGVMRLTSVGPERTPVFRADHPFIFMIHEDTSGSILFFGRVMNPQSEG